MDRRKIITAIVLVTIAFASLEAVTPQRADAGVPRGPCAEIRWKRGTWQRKQLVRCAAAWRGFDASPFLQVGLRESGATLYPKAVSWTGCCRGIFQHHRDYWLGRARAYLERSWFAVRFPDDDSPYRMLFNGRANVLAAATMWDRQNGPCPAWC